MAKVSGKNEDINNKLQKVANENNKPVEQKKTVIDIIQSRKQELSEMLPKHMPVDKFMRVVTSAILANPLLKVCTPVSLMEGIKQAAQIGLEINTPLKQAYLIPYKRRKNINGQWVDVYEASFQYGYGGLEQLVWQSGMITDLDFDMICENDTFEYRKTSEKVIFDHSLALRKPRGEAYAYYASAHLKGGGFAVVAMNKEDILAHANKFSKSKDYKSGELTGPWKDDFDSMAIKTVMIMLADKKLPKSADKDNIVFQNQLVSDDELKHENDKDVTPSSGWDDGIQDVNYTPVENENSNDPENAAEKSDENTLQGSVFDEKEK